VERAGPHSVWGTAAGDAGDLQFAIGDLG
jgi:hypothetical protein